MSEDWGGHQSVRLVRGNAGEVDLGPTQGLEKPGPRRKGATTGGHSCKVGNMHPPGTLENQSSIWKKYLSLVHITPNEEKSWPFFLLNWVHYQFHKKAPRVRPSKNWDRAGGKCIRGTRLNWSRRDNLFLNQQQHARPYQEVHWSEKNIIFLVIFFHDIF